MALYPLPSAIILYKLPFTCRFFPKSLYSITAASAAGGGGITAVFPQHLSYGPSLYKGHKSSHQNSDEENFTRVFDITALRVPAEHCFSLESKLRGHLLNWPRIRNISRVPGDDVEDELKDFIGNNGNTDDENLAVLERRIYGKGEGDGEKMCSVLYRDKLAKTFNSTGYVKFQNLAKISRPKKRKKWKREEKEGNGRERRGYGKSDMSMVEVDEEEGSGDEDFSGLLGDDFRRRKWSGSTRLLLLDERQSSKNTMRKVQD